MQAGAGDVEGAAGGTGSCSSTLTASMSRLRVHCKVAAFPQYPVPYFVNSERHGVVLRAFPHCNFRPSA